MRTRVSAVAAQTVRSDTVLFGMCVCQGNKNIIYRRVQGVCLRVWAGDGLCLRVCVRVFYFLFFFLL